MKLFPFEHIIYKTKLSKIEVLERISNNIEPVKIRFLIFNPDLKKYEGRISERNFEIRKILRGRNSFSPQIFGTVSNDNYGTKIEVKMKLHLDVKIFTLFWCIPLVLIPFIILINEEVVDLLAFLIPIFMAVMMYFGFKTESKKSKIDLKNLFEAEMKEL